MRHASEDKNDVFCSVFTELKTLGVKVPKIKKFKSSIPKQARPVSAFSSSSGKIFGVYLSEQEKIPVADYLLPKFIVTSTSYLKKFSRKEIGLFRKAGSVSRQRDLRAKLENGESIEGSEPNDVASLLKQWLRELPEPLIPTYLHDLFVRCQNLQVEENRINAVLLCCHLLPVDHLHTLKHLLSFLTEIATNSDKNKMGAHNLALIMAPNIFVMGRNSIDKSSNNLVRQHTSVIELLINNVQRFDELPSCSSLHLAEAEALKYNPDFDLSIDALDYSPPKSKKKRRSGGPVQDIFTGIRKLVGQNSVSPNPRRLNENDIKLMESRSASKRKAEPDQQYMSPFKKLATTTNISPNESLNFTPNSKSIQNVFGIKEKNINAQSQKKTFGLLKRKEKKKKSVRSSISGETTHTTSTPYLFQEKIEASFKEPVQETSLENSSPILSPIDIDKLFSNPIFVKKSISDCYLTVPKNDYKNGFLFSTSSSEGCLQSKESNQSPYYLRSDSKRATKRKSDMLNKLEESIEIAEKDEETNGLSCSPWFKRKNSKTSFKPKRSPKVENLSAKDINSMISFNGDKAMHISYCFDETDSVNFLQTADQRCSSYKNENSECFIKSAGLSSVSKLQKSVDSKDLVGSDFIGVNDKVLDAVTTKSDVVSTEPIIQNREAVRRKCSINRQEAFIIKSSSKKKSLNQIKRADSIKLSKSKNNRINQKNGDLNCNAKNSKTAGLNSTSEVNLDKKDEKIVSVSISDKKRTRRNVRNGSIVRGRPNTVKTGLRSDACSRYNNESVSVNKSHQLCDSSLVDNNMSINVGNHSKDNVHDISITLQIQSITLSSPKEENFATNIKDAKKLRAVKSSSPRKSLAKEITISSEVEKENACVPESSQNLDSNVQKTPETNVQTPNVKNDVQNCTSQTIISPDVNNVALDKMESTVISVSETTAEVKEQNDMLDVRKTNTAINSPRVRRSTSKRKVRERLCSNSDSKIHKMKRRSSKVSRINSFPESGKKLKPKDAKKLRAVKSSSPRKSLAKEITISSEVEKENACVPESSKNSDSNVQKTPETNVQTPEVWVSGRKFLEAEEETEEEICNKRESIAMILKNNTGHVKAKVHLYDYKSRGSSANTPVMLRNSIPGDRLYDAHYSNMLAKQSQKKSASVRSSRSIRRNSPLPPPPKFFIPESSPSYPLKELTNISNSEDTVFSPSPSKKFFSTQNNDEMVLEKTNKKYALKTKRNSFSGHTPFKLPADKNKVSRSESSPVLARVALVKKSHEFLGSIKDSSSSPCSRMKHPVSPIPKTNYLSVGLDDTFET